MASMQQSPQLTSGPSRRSQLVGLRQRPQVSRKARRQQASRQGLHLQVSRRGQRLQVLKQGQRLETMTSDRCRQHLRLLVTAIPSHSKSGERHSALEASTSQSC